MVFPLIENEVLDQQIVVRVRLKLLRKRSEADVSLFTLCKPLTVHERDTLTTGIDF